jgi:hypothetical protein
MWPLIEITATAVDWFGIVLTLSTAIVTLTAAFFLHRFFRRAMREM